MNQIAEMAVIAAISYGSIEWGMGFPTNTATRVYKINPGRIEAGRKVAGFSTDAAESAAKRLGLAFAALTNWKPGDFDQWSTTNTAIGGKKSKEEAGSNALCPVSDRRGRSCELGSPYSKPSTAEDGLPHPEGGGAAPGDTASIVSL